MPINIYNSLTRKKEEFKAINHPKVKMYTCGVTVYDSCHIGHARSLYIFDVIRRYLSSRGFEVSFVRNITDIDDKIINRSNELKIDWLQLVNKFIASYHEDLASLGLARADIEPRASENIQEMIQYISSLIEKGYAYVSGGDVYFNVRKFASYGKLSGQSIDLMETGVRKDPTETKKDPLDFALWKSSKPNEPFWGSPWGEGRPGWHIECSVMSQKYLATDTLDIHAGGRDLIFPHHENEVAQSEALTGKPFANYWMHGGLLTINGQKMAKSLGNFITIKDFINRYKNADYLKLFFLSAHYSHPIDYTDEKIEEAKKAYERILILLGKIEAVKESENQELVLDFKKNFLAVMDDDFNTSLALAQAFELVNAINKNITNSEFVAAGKGLLKQMFLILGLNFKAQEQGEGIKDSEIEEKINQRNAARKSKNFFLSDSIRKDLEARGVILEDTKDGLTTWRRKL